MDSARKDIVSIIGHEIRTPLIAIQGYVELLKKEKFGNLNETQHKKLKIVSDNVDRLCKKINEIIQLSRLEFEEDSQLDTEIIPIKDTLNNIISLQKKKSELELDIDMFFPEKEIYIKTHQTYFHQILIIILDNSLKFNRGRPEISIEVKKDKDKVNIYIKDHGIGVSEENLPYIFNDFFQEYSGACRTYPGLGLGLSLAKKLILRLGGDIEVTSIKDESFTAKLIFPITIQSLNND